MKKLFLLFIITITTVFVNAQTEANIFTYGSIEAKNCFSKNLNATIKNALYDDSLKVFQLDIENDYTFQYLDSNYTKCPFNGRFKSHRIELDSFNMIPFSENGYKKFYPFLIATGYNPAYYQMYGYLNEYEFSDQLRCFDFNTKKQLWKGTVPNGYGIQNIKLLSDDSTLLFVADKLYALNVNTGKTLWKIKSNVAMYSHNSRYNLASNLNNADYYSKIVVPYDKEDEANKTCNLIIDANAFYYADNNSIRKFNNQGKLIWEVKNKLKGHLRIDCKLYHDTLMYFEIKNLRSEPLLIRYLNANTGATILDTQIANNFSSLVSYGFKGNKQIFVFEKSILEQDNHLNIITNNNFVNLKIKNNFITAYHLHFYRFDTLQNEAIKVPTLLEYIPCDKYYNFYFDNATRYSYKALFFLLDTSNSHKLFNNFDDEYIVCDKNNKRILAFKTNRPCFVIKNELIIFNQDKLRVFKLPQ
jgi:hypothetical protein